MSQENIKKFFEMIANNPEFKKQVFAATTREQIRSLLKNHNLTFTKEEYEAVWAYKETLPLSKHRRRNRKLQRVHGVAL